MIRCILFAGVLFNLAACQSEADPPRAGADSVADTAGVAESAADAGSAAARDAPVLALDPEGLRVVDPSTGSTDVLAFRMDEEAVVAAVSNLLGPAARQGVNDECGEGPLAFASWPGGLNLNFSDGRFSGWSVHGDEEGAERHSTPSGIRIGSTRAELESAYDIRTGVSSLGTEFAAGGLHGVLGGTGSNARVTSLWSGSACIFR